MPAAKHLTVLVALLTVTVGSGATIPPATEQGTVTNTGAAQLSNFTSSSSVNYTSSATTQITTDVTSASPQTPRTEETNPSLSSVTTPITHTSTEEVSQGETVSSASGSTTSGNTTVLSPSWEKGALASNPGLVAVLCIFCIVFGLVLVVVTVKCVRSPRSSFERLEDVPLGKVNEESPFAQYSK